MEGKACLNQATGKQLRGKNKAQRIAEQSCTIVAIWFEPAGFLFCGLALVGVDFVITNVSRCES